MIFPLNFAYEWSQGSEMIAAFGVGILFGFFLEQAGFGNARKLALTFYLRDMTVVKVMFSAIITAMVGLMIFRSAGLLDWDAVSLNSSYLWPSLLGGVVMGVGFVIGGYCPGTAFVGAATLKMDAFFALLGGAFGVFLYGEAYPWLADFMASGDLGEALTLPEWLGVSPWVVVVGVLAMAGGMFALSEYFEKRFGEK